MDGVRSYISVCSGAAPEGPILEALGFTCRLHADINTHVQDLLRYRYPETPLYGDLRDIEDHHGTNLTLLIGGPPCQDFSNAGLRKGLDGERGSTSLAYIALIDRLRPSWFIWENVHGVFSSWSPDVQGGSGQDEGERHTFTNDFDQFTCALGELGYHLAYRTLDLQYFGAPQLRRRVFVVGHHRDGRGPAAVLFDPQSLPGHPPKIREAWQNAARGPESRARSSSVYRDKAATLKAKYHNYVDPAAAAGGLIAFHTKQDPVPQLGKSPAIGTTSQGMGFYGGNSRFPRERATALKAHHSGQRLDFESDTFVIQQHGTNVGPMGTLRAGNGHNHGIPIHVQQAPRRFMPIECERLMGWPDDWTRYGRRENGRVYEMSDSQRYQRCGNGWGLPVIAWILTRLSIIDNLIEDKNHGT